MKNVSLIKKIKPEYPFIISGKVTKVAGLVVEADGPLLGIGSRCKVFRLSGEFILGEIIGVRDERIIIMLYGGNEDISLGSIVISDSSRNTVLVSDSILGRVLNGFGDPMDNLGGELVGIPMPIYADCPAALSRSIISTPISTGIKAIDGLLTVGKGQRMGIFAGSGVGKSVILGMIARNTNADINVIALIGERGRELLEFIKNDLGEEGLKRSVLVVATSDDSALARRAAPFVATAIAEYFRDKGQDVLLMMDSLTRLAMAQREIGLSVGEPPTAKAYPPSVYSLLPKLLERAGSVEGKGSITGLYAVLVEGDDMNDPIADTVRSIIDGHIVLDRALAAKNHYPSINVLASASRVMRQVIEEDQFRRVGMLKDLLATYNDAEDIINIGAYVKGSNPKIDQSINKIAQINSFLKQGITEKFSFDDTKNLLTSIIA